MLVLTAQSFHPLRPSPLHRTVPWFSCHDSDRQILVSKPDLAAGFVAPVCFRPFRFLSSFSLPSLLRCNSSACICMHRIMQISDNLESNNFEGTWHNSFRPFGSRKESIGCSLSGCIAYFRIKGDTRRLCNNDTIYESYSTFHRSKLNFETS